MKRALLAIVLLALVLPFSTLWEESQPTELEQRANKRAQDREQAEARAAVTGTGTVTGVPGATQLIVQTANGTHTQYELPGIVVPDCLQQTARNALRDYALQKMVVIHHENNTLRLGSQDLSGWLIWNGYAFADASYPHPKQQEYKALAQRAKEEKGSDWPQTCE